MFSRHKLYTILNNFVGMSVSKKYWQRKAGKTDKLFSNFILKFYLDNDEKIAIKIL